MLPFHRTARPSRPWASFTHLLILIPFLALGACAASSDDSTPAEEEETADTGITAGTIGGLAFTVIAGNVFQEEENGPLTAGEDGGSIAFDDTVTSIILEEPGLYLHATVQYEDGGRIAGAAYGTVENLLADGWGLSMTRSGGSFPYEFRQGFDGTIDGSGTVPDPADAAGELYFSLVLRADNPPSGYVYDIELADPYSVSCSEFEVGAGSSAAANSGGDNFGLNFSKVTIQDLSAAGDSYNGC